MKRTIIFLISFLIVSYCNYCNELLAAENPGAASDSIRIFSSPDLLNISTKWEEEYNNLFPGTKIKIISVSTDEISDNNFKECETGFVSDKYYRMFNKESVSKFVVGRDIIVPVINSKNPYLEDISLTGISPEKLKTFLISEDPGKWSTILDGGQSSNANLYFYDDNIVTQAVKDFLGDDNIKIRGIKVENSTELLSAIQKDMYSIGFCRMIDILNLEKQTIREEISLLPIDRNNNGRIDYNESIYNDFTDFSRGVWIGKYPKALYSNIYSLSFSQPMKEADAAFLKWVIDDGQQFLNAGGYSDLLMSERKTITDKLYEAQVYAGNKSGNVSVLKALLIIVLSLVITGLMLDFIFRYIKRKKSQPSVETFNLHPVLDMDGLVVPAGLSFDKTHTWAFMEQNGLVKVGIDDFLQHITGIITRVKMKNVGDEVKKGDYILSLIQNGKQLNLYAPVSGIIKEKNPVLLKDASLLNSSPYNEGWVYRIEPSNWHRENQLLFMSGRHIEFIKNEVSRLKDFLAALLVSDEEIYSRVILQDGGELVDNTLSDLGPEVWDDFQSKFIDTSRQVWFHELY